jgi:DNA-binding Lrp family transcriptional regulator
MFCENERALSRRTGLISSIAGCKHPQILRNPDALGFRRCEMKLSRTDLMILKSLRKQPRKSASQVAEEIGVSVRTVERRIADLTAGNAILHMINIDFQKLDGVASSAFVTYEDEKRKSMLDSLITSRLDRLLFSATGGTKTSQFTFVCRNVAETDGIRQWIRELDGVSQFRLGLVKEYILVTKWLDDEIDEML